MEGEEADAAGVEVLLLLADVPVEVAELRVDHELLER